MTGIVLQPVRASVRVHRVVGRHAVAAEIDTEAAVPREGDARDPLPRSRLDEDAVRPVLEDPVLSDRVPDRGRVVDEDSVERVALDPVPVTFHCAADGVAHGGVVELHAVLTVPRMEAVPVALSPIQLPRTVFPLAPVRMRTPFVPLPEIMFPCPETAPDEFPLGRGHDDAVAALTQTRPRWVVPMKLPP